MQCIVDSSLAFINGNHIFPKLSKLNRVTTDSAKGVNYTLELIFAPNCYILSNLFGDDLIE